MFRLFKPSREALAMLVSVVTQTVILNHLNQPKDKTPTSTFPSNSPSKELADKDKPSEPTQGSGFECRR